MSNFRISLDDTGKTSKQKKPTKQTTPTTKKKQKQNQNLVIPEKVKR